jgi:periplasmic protein TonB
MKKTFIPPVFCVQSLPFRLLLGIFLCLCLSIASIAQRVPPIPPGPTPAENPIPPMPSPVPSPPPPPSPSSPSEDMIFEVVEDSPTFVGGTEMLLQYIQSNLVYPKAAKDAKVEGRVFLRFVVWKDGSIGNIEILKSIGFGCDEESVRITKAMPKWIPGKQSGKAVNTKYNMPISFVLGN